MDGGVKMVLRCLSCTYLLLGSDSQLCQAGRCLAACVYERVHHREWGTGELWHVPGGTGVFITLAKFSLMGYSWLMGGKGWKGWWSEEGDTVPKCVFFKCHQRVFWKE